MKNVIALTLTLALLLCTCVTALAAPSATFYDVKEGDWYAQDVAYVYEHGLMSGAGNQSFAVKSPATRAMLVTILHRLEGAPAAAGSAFQDVASGAYYAAAVAWAAENGIVDGVGNGRFAPDQAISREQLAVVLCRYAQYKGWDTAASADLSAFQDQGQAGSYALPALRWAMGQGLISGTSANTLSPKDSAQRAQVAAILHRFCENVAQTKPAANGSTLVLAPARAAVLDQMPQSFDFASGVGAWSTGLTLYADGSFEGFYHDADMGDIGPGYPNGTVYVCGFHGKFVDFTQVSDYEYTMRLAELNLDEPEGTSWIEDQVRFITAKAYGIQGGSRFCLYLPGCPTRDLPEEYLDWIRMPFAWSTVPAALPFWGLYNVEQQDGFFGA